MEQLYVLLIPPKRWWQRARWRLFRPYESHGGVLVPIGFETDGASVPWLLRWIVSPTGPAMPAAVVHDYLLTQGCSWRSAARQFRGELQRLGIPAWRVWLMYRAVRLWGWIRGYQ